MVPASGRVGWTNLFAQRKNSKKFPSSHNCIFFSHHFYYY